MKQRAVRMIMEMLPQETKTNAQKAVNDLHLYITTRIEKAVEENKQREVESGLASWRHMRNIAEKNAPDNQACGTASYEIKKEGGDN